VKWSSIGQAIRGGGHCIRSGCAENGRNLSNQKLVFEPGEN